VIRLGLTVIGTVLAVAWGEGIWVLAILGMTVAISDLITGFGLHSALDRVLPPSLEPVVRPERLVNLVIAAMSVAFGVGAATLSRTMMFPGRFTEAAVGAVTVAATYLIMQRLRGSPELEELVAVFRRPANA
jgi:hypothetical protein